MECNFTTPCVQWKEDSCLDIAACVSTECSKEVLSEYHLSVEEDKYRNKYIEGDEIRVSCDDQYEFEDKEDSIIIQCMNTNWHSRSGEKIPKCLRYSDCEMESIDNVRLSGDSTRLNSGDGSFIIDHDSSARYVVIFETIF